MRCSNIMVVFSRVATFPVEIYSEILHYSWSGDILHFANVSHAFQNIAFTHLQSRYKQLVRPYADPARLGLVLKESGAVISGSKALRFMQWDETWECQDLDVYVPWVSFPELLWYFRDVEGYADVEGDTAQSAGINTGPNEPYARLAGIDDIARLYKGSRRVDLIRSKTDSPLLPITYFWSTAVMNILTADYFAVAYPRLTAVKKCYITPLVRESVDEDTGMDDILARCMRKYHHRGFEMCISRRDLDHRQAAQTGYAVQRSFEDRQTLSVEFKDGEGRKVRGAVQKRCDWEVKWQLGGQAGNVMYEPSSRTVDRITGEVQAHRYHR